MDIIIKNHERVEDLGRKGLRIIQNPEGFRFGMDAVLLSHFAKTRSGDRVVDLGTGTGIIPLLMWGRNPGAFYYGVEVEPSMAEMAKRSITLNQLEDSIKIIEGDLKESPSFLGHRTFQVVTANPPYKKVGTGLINPNRIRAIARHEILCSLGDVLKAASKLLIEGGRLFMVHRPDRLNDIILDMKKNGLEPKVIRLVYPRVDKPPNMVLIEAVLGGKPYLKWMAPLIVFNSDGDVTSEVSDIYSGD